MQQESFTSTIHSSNICSLERCTVRPFIRDKFKVVETGIEPLPLRPRLPVDAEQNTERL